MAGLFDDWDYNVEPMDTSFSGQSVVTVVDNDDSFNGDRTLTPGTPMSFSELPASSSSSHRSARMSSTQTPFRGTPMPFSEHCAASSSTHRSTCTSRSPHHDSTRSSVKTYSGTRKVSFSSSTQHPSTSKSNIRSTPWEPTIQSGVTIKVIPPTPGKQSSRRRRSLSASEVGGNNSDVDDLLEDSLKSLKLSCKKQSHAQGTPMRPVSGARSLQMCISSTQTGHVKSTTKEAKIISLPKRERSPPPPTNECDYSRQPNKYIRRTQPLKTLQRQGPVKLETSAKSKQMHLRKGSNARSTHTSSVEVPTSERGVRVARWPLPKFEPIPYKESKKNEEIHTDSVKVFKAGSGPNEVNIVDSNKIKRRTMGRVVTTVTKSGEITKTQVGNFGTPTVHQQRPCTKVEPFSFDQRDQEIIQRKLARRNGEFPTTCQPTESTITRGRRRSKSAGSVNSNSTSRARIPTVLYKDPFVPKKTHAHTKPIPLTLHTDKRAAEREAFEKELREKEIERQNLLKEFQERIEKEEQQKLKTLRKELVHKARPVPAYQIFKCISSNKELTEPESPAIRKPSKPH